MDNFTEKKMSFDNIVNQAEGRKEEKPEINEKIEQQKKIAQFEYLKEQRKSVQEQADAKPYTEPKKRKARKSLGRTQEMKARFTVQEEKTIRAKIKVSGMPQGEYIRQLLLNGKVEVVDHTETLFNVLSELAKIKAELGRQGGLLKMIIKPNLGQRELSHREWESLIICIKDMEANKKKIEELERRIINGDYQTFVQQE